jgi:outer membrane protein assembly factor BamB
MAGAGGASAAGWTTYRGNNARTGVTDERVNPPLSLQWVFEPSVAPKPAWPAPAEEMPRMHEDDAYHATIAEGMVFFGTSVDDQVYAIDCNAGTVRWTFLAEGPVRYAPTHHAGKLYFGSDDGYVHCLNASNGKLIWRYRAGPTNARILGNGRMISVWPVRTSVLVDNGEAYFAAGVFPYEGLYICALNAQDGSVGWKNDTIGDRAHDLEFGGISPHGYLVASESILYVPSGRAMPAAFDRKSGKFLYCAPTSGKQGGTWALLDQDRLIAGVDRSGAPAKVAIDAKTGEGKGDVYGWFPGIDLVTTPDVAYTLTRTGIYAVDRERYPKAEGEADASAKRRKSLAAKLKILREKVSEEKDEAAAGESREQIDAINQELTALFDEEEKRLRGSVYRWSYGREDLSALIMAGTVIFAGGKGSLVAVDSETGKEIWSEGVKGTVSGLSAAAGTLVASTTTGAVYCFTEGKGGAQKRIASQADPAIFQGERRRDVYQEAAGSVLSEIDARKGYCLVLDCGVGQLAYELAEKTDFRIIGLEKDPRKLAAARGNLGAAGLLGSRVVVYPWDLSELPDYFANLIVSDGMLVTGEMKHSLEDVFRVLKPCGGRACFSAPRQGAPSPGSSDLGDLARWVKDSQRPDLQILREEDSRVVVARGELPGAGSWTHLYANPGNTACSDDELVRAPFGVLWYGEPGPQGMMERHGRSVGPVSINGRLFIQGEELIQVYDAYNGTLLWRREIPGAVRARADVDGGNLALTESALFVAAHEKCLELDPATGDTVRTFDLPASPDGGARRWGYIAVEGDVLVGTAAMPLANEYASEWKKLAEQTDEARQAMEREGNLWQPVADFPSWDSQSSPKNSLTEKLMAGDAIFAHDTKTGRRLWERRGKRIPNIAAAIGGGRVLFVEESVSPEERQAALEEKRALVKKGVYEESVEADFAPEDLDVRRVVALNVGTGEKAWEKVMDVTGCGGDRMGATFAQGVLLFYGFFSNHDGSYFRGGALRWRRVTALSAETGDAIWSRPLNYLRRPLVIGDRIIIEPRACDLKTGKIAMREHPISGAEVPWEFLRPGHCCSISSAAPHAMFFRSYWTAIYDVTKDGGLSLFGGMRLGCWLNAISANGLVMMPEASAGCTCSFPLRTTVVMSHRKHKAPGPWSVFITHGPTTPVKHLAVNFGAPGDVRDETGTVWFGYPRPRTESNTGYGDYAMKFEFEDEIIPGAEGYFCEDHRGKTVAGTERPWLFKSGCKGLVKCRVRLANDADAAGQDRYTVRMGFLAPAHDDGDRDAFDVKLQDRVVAENLDVVEIAGAAQTAVVREFKGVPGGERLTVELVPKGEPKSFAQTTIVSFLEVVREGEMPKAESAFDRAGAQALLQKANESLEAKDPKTALGLFHEVFDASPDGGLKLQAVKGMASIGSPDSLERLRTYWDSLSAAPILRDYESPDVSILVAIASCMAVQDKAQAVEILKKALSATTSLDARADLIRRLEGLGADVSAYGDMVCGRRKEPVIADGDLKEWGELPIVCREPAQIEVSPETWQGPDDLSFRLAVEHDDQYVYVAVDAVDNDRVFDPAGYPWNQDGIEIRLDARPDPIRSNCRGEGESSDFLFLALSPGATPDQTIAYGEEKCPTGMKVACVRTPKGHATEIAVPVAYLNGKQGGEWKALRLNVAVDDFDEAGIAGGSQIWWRPDWRDPVNYIGSGTFRKE